MLLLLNSCSWLAYRREKLKWENSENLIRCTDLHSCAKRMMRQGLERSSTCLLIGPRLELSALCGSGYHDLKDLPKIFELRIFLLSRQQ